VGSKPGSFTSQMRPRRILEFLRPVFDDALGTWEEGDRGSAMACDHARTRYRRCRQTFEDRALVACGLWFTRLKPVAGRSPFSIRN